jgi:hypothetical protein
MSSQDDLTQLMEDLPPYLNELQNSNHQRQQDQSQAQSLEESLYQGQKIGTSEKSSKDKYDKLADKLKDFFSKPIGALALYAMAKHDTLLMNDAVILGDNIPGLINDIVNYSRENKKLYEILEKAIELTGVAAIVSDVIGIMFAIGTNHGLIPNLFGLSKDITGQMGAGSTPNN